MAKSKKKKRPPATPESREAQPAAPPPPLPRTVSDYLIGFLFALFTGALCLFVLDGLIETANTGAMCGRKSCTYWSESPFNLGLAFVMLSGVALALGTFDLGMFVTLLTPE